MTAILPLPRLQACHCLACDPATGLPHLIGAPPCSRRGAAVICALNERRRIVVARRRSGRRRGASRHCQDGDIVKNRSLASRGLGQRAWRDLARLLVESLATGAFVSVVLALAVFIVATQAHAATGAAPEAVAPVGFVDPALALA
ncbi:MAG: hypothetical protein WA900_08840, partial [Casimicrobiaceae bacterium]